MFTRRAADVISEASFTTMTGDRDDELAAMDLNTVAVALTPLWLVWIQQLCQFGDIFVIPVLFCFVSEHKILYTIRELAVFDVYYRT